MRTTHVTFALDTSHAAAVTAAALELHGADGQALVEALAGSDESPRLVVGAELPLGPQLAEAAEQLRRRLVVIARVPSSAITFSLAA